MIHFSVYIFRTEITSNVYNIPIFIRRRIFSHIFSQKYFIALHRIKYIPEQTDVITVANKKQGKLLLECVKFKTILQNKYDANKKTISAYCEEFQTIF